MNGATALDCEKTISRPSSRNTMTIGASQYFFSALRNWKNSPTRLSFDMGPSFARSEQVLVVLRVAQPDRIRDPERSTPTPHVERIAAEQPAHDADWPEDEHEHQGQQDARVDPSECMADARPARGETAERRRPDQCGEDEGPSD